MKKLLLLLLFVPLVSFGQMKQNEKDLKILISQQWFEYSKSFEYKDYENIVKHFTFPVTFNYSKEPVIIYIGNLEEFISF